MGIKRALLVGINTYPSAPLRGCVNDVLAMEELLSNLYGFHNIRLLTDNEATTDNIRRELNALVDNAVSGDTIYFHYSGHGSQVLDSATDSDYEADGLDEIICPVDLNWRDKMITDDELKSIFDRVPMGVNLTVTLDCCNSGGGMDHDNQYQALGEAARKIEDGGRYLPPPDLTEDQAQQLEEYMGFKPRALSRNINATALMISGCQAHQTSADAYIDGMFMGACTYYLAKNLRLSPTTDYKTLVDRMNNNMVTNGFTQRPELNGPESLFTKSYLNSFTESDLVEIPTAPPADAPNAQMAPEPKKDKNKLMIGIAIAAAAALAYFILG